jgi:hypothetical protein
MSKLAKTVWTCPTAHDRWTEEDIKRICDWARAQGVDPDRVSTQDVLSIDLVGDGTLSLRFRRKVADGEGRDLPCPTCASCVQTEPASVPLVTAPPAMPGEYHWRSWTGPNGEALVATGWEPQP